MNGISRNYLALLAIISAAILGGGTPTFSKIGLKEFPPLSFVFTRFLLSLLFLGPFLVKEKPRLTKSGMKVLLLSLLATANVIFFTFGIRRTSATVGQMLYGGVTFITAILAHTLLKERISSFKVIGIILGLVGMSMIVLLPVLGQSSKLGDDFIGNLTIFAGVVSFSLYTVLSKKIQRKYSPFYLTLAFTITTLIVSGIIAISETASNPGWWLQISVSAWLAVAYVGIISTALYYLLYQFAIKHGSPTLASMTLYLQPAAAFGWAAILLGERLTTIFVIGAILALSGAWWTTQSNRAQKQ